MEQEINSGKEIAVEIETILSSKYENSES